MTAWLEVARSAQMLAPVFAAWACIAGFVAVRAGSQGVAASARRAIVAAAGLAALAVAGVVVALVTADLGVRIVAAQSSIATPLRYVPASILADSGAAQLFVSAGIAVVSLVVLPRQTLARAAAVAHAGAGAVLTVMLASVALRLDPTGPAALAGEGAGLDPVLHAREASIMGVALGFSCIAAAARYLLSLDEVAERGEARPPRAGPARAAAWSAAASAALAVALVGGLRWTAHMPSVGPWWRGDALAAWIAPLVLAVTLAMRDSRSRDDGDTTMRGALAGALLATCLAAWAANGGALIRAPGSPVSAAAVWLGPLAVAVAGLTVWRVLAVRGGAGSAPRHATRLSPVPDGPAVVGAAWMLRAGTILVVGAIAGSFGADSQTVTVDDAAVVRARDPFGHDWTFASQGTSTFQRENYSAAAFAMVPVRDGAALPILSAEARSYLHWNRETARPGVVVMTAGLHRTPFVETRISLAAVPSDHARATVRISFVPLAPWLVPGVVLLVGGLLLRAATSDVSQPRIAA